MSARVSDCIAPPAMPAAIQKKRQLPASAKEEEAHITALGGPGWQCIFAARSNGQVSDRRSPRVVPAVAAPTSQRQKRGPSA